jgi:hypothetical protein
MPEMAVRRRQRAHPEGTAITDGVVHSEHEQVILAAQLDYQHPDQRALLQLKWHSRLALQPRQNRRRQRLLHSLGAAQRERALLSLFIQLLLCILLMATSYTVSEIGLRLPCLMYIYDIMQDMTGTAGAHKLL